MSSRPMFIQGSLFLLPKSWMFLFNSLADFERAVNRWKRFSLALQSCFSLPCGQSITISPVPLPYHYHSTYTTFTFAFTEPAFRHGLHE